MSHTGKTMAYEELFTDLLQAEQEEDVTDALTVFGLERFSDSNWLPYGGIENNWTKKARSRRAAASYGHGQHI